MPRKRAHHPGPVPATPTSARRQAAIQAAIQGFRRAFTGFHRLMSAASGGEISLSDAFALHFVAHTGDVTPGEIGAFTGLTSGSVTTMLDRLERAGFISRKRSTQDRRVVLVNLRPGAHQKLVRIMLKAHDDVGNLFQGWSVDRIETLVGLLEGLELGSPVHSERGHDGRTRAFPGRPTVEGA